MDQEPFRSASADLLGIVLRHACDVRGSYLRTGSFLPLPWFASEIAGSLSLRLESVFSLLSSFPKDQLPSDLPHCTSHVASPDSVSLEFRVLSDFGRPFGLRGIPARFPTLPETLRYQKDDL